MKFLENLIQMMKNNMNSSKYSIRKSLVDKMNEDYIESYDINRIGRVGVETLKVFN
jgi:hypothetical protein